MRDREPSDQCLIVAGSDPLNLEGIITSASRIGAKASNSLALRDGRVVAALESGLVRFHDQFAPAAAAEITRRLRRTG